MEVWGCNCELNAASWSTPKNSLSASLSLSAPPSLSHSVSFVTSPYLTYNRVFERFKAIMLHSNDLQKLFVFDITDTFNDEENCRLFVSRVMTLIKYC